MVDKETVVFAPRVHVVDAAEALERARPAVYIGNDVDVTMAFLREHGVGLRWGKPAGTASGNPVLETLGRFREGVEGRSLSLMEEDWCKCTTFYWRRGVGVGEGGKGGV